MGQITLAISQPVPYSSSSSSNQVFKPMVSYLTTTPKLAYHRGFNSFHLCSEYAHVTAVTVRIMISIETFFAFLY